MTGWIKGDNAINTGLVAEELARLTKENEQLKIKLSDVNSTALYSTLTYEQLKELLMNRKINVDNEVINLHKFIIDYGKHWTNTFQLLDLLNDMFGMAEGRDKHEIFTDAFEMLCECKILKRVTIGVYEFTSDGHNYYLRSLALQSHDKFNCNNFKEYSYCSKSILPV